MRVLLIGLVALALSGCVGRRRRRAARADRDRRRRHHGRLLRATRKALAAELETRDARPARRRRRRRAGRWRTCAWSPTGGRRSRSPPPTRPPRPRSAARRSARRLPIAALARVYDDYMHLVVPASSRVRSIAQLDGRTVSVGPSGVGHAADRRAPARRARGGAARRRTRARRVGRGAARRAHLRVLLVRRPADARASTPSPATEPLRLLALDERLDGLQARFGAVYRAAAIPSGTYGLTRQVSTIAVPNLLVTHERRRRGAGPARHRDAIRAARRRSPAPSWPPPRSTAAPRSRPPPLSCIPPPCDWYRDTKT